MGCSPSSRKQRDVVYGRSVRGGRSTGLSSRTYGTGSYTWSSSNVSGPPRVYMHHNRNFPDGDANQGSLKKRLRRQLSSRVKAGTLEELEETLKKCEDFRLPPDELYFRGVRKVEYLRMKNALRNAVRRRHYSTLRDAISKVESSPYASELTNSLQAARGVLQDLAYTWSGEPMRHNMGYSSVSEVRRFKSPPASVIDSVKACYLLIGTPSSNVKTWPMIRALLCRTGREGILAQMTKFDPSNLPLKTYKMADSLIRRWHEHEVATVSLEAASFWAWANTSLNRKYNQISWR